jgi:hypothetical protein
MAKLADRLTALVTMSPAQSDEWQRSEGITPPTLPPDLLRRMFAHRMQEKRHGGLPVAVVRELARVASGASGEGASRPEPTAIRPGTRLVREWQGKTISVLAVDDGFLWDERPYRSLTAIAREVTGARWSGPRFFGLTAHA